MTKLPDFRIQVNGPVGPYAVQWRDDAKGRRYHFWLDERAKMYESGQYDGTLYSNPIDDSEATRQGAIQLDATSKRWAPIVNGMIDMIQRTDMIRTERTIFIEKQKRFAATLRHERAAKLREAMSAVCPELRRLDDETLLALAAAARL